MPSRHSVTPSSSRPAQAEHVAEVDVGEPDVVRALDLAGDRQRLAEQLHAPGRGRRASPATMPSAFSAVPSSRRAPSARGRWRARGRRGLLGLVEPGPGGRQQREAGVHAGGERARVAVGEQVHGAAEGRPGRPPRRRPRTAPQPSRSSSDGPALRSSVRVGQGGLEEPDGGGALAGHAGRRPQRGWPGRPGRCRTAPGRAARGPGEAVVGVGERVHPLVGPARPRRTPRAPGRGRRPGASAGRPRRRPRGRRPDSRVERLGGRPVQPGPLPRQQLGVHDLAERRVVEADAVVVADLGDVGGDGHAEHVLDVLLVGADGAGQQRHRRDPADHGGGAQHAAGVARQVVDPGPEQLVQRGRQRTRPVAPARTSCSTNSGFPAERSSVSSSRSGGSGRPASSATRRAASARSSRGHLDPVRGQPAELGQPRAERPGLVAGVLAVGQQHQHPLVGEVRGQERQQVQGRAVGPVHVLDDVQHRSAGRSSGPAARAPPGTAGAGEVAPEPGSGAGRWPSAPSRRGSSRASSGDRCVSCGTTPEPLLRRSAWVSAAYGSGSPATGTQAPARAVGVRARHELGDQAGLADAGLARDDDHGRVAHRRACSSASDSCCRMPSRPTSPPAVRRCMGAIMRPIRGCRHREYRGLRHPTADLRWVPDAGAQASFLASSSSPTRRHERNQR